MSDDYVPPAEISLERIADALEQMLQPETATLEAISANAELSDAAFLDECAMRAMGSLAKLVMNDLDYDVFARSSYLLADAMLAERKRRREGK